MNKQTLAANLNAVITRLFLHGRSALWAILLLGCISCNDDDINPSLSVNLGEDKAIQIGQSLLINGRLATHSENSIKSFHWVFTKKPSASRVSLNNPSDEKITFVPDVSGIYEIKLTVSTRSQHDSDKMLIIVLDASLTE
jgi:hypothetical protein